MAKTNEETREATYTTAPVDYDYTGFGTVDCGVVGSTSNGKPVRKVTTFLSKTEYQRGRYGSGLHLSADENEFGKLVAYGFVKLADHLKPLPRPGEEISECDECGSLGSQCCAPDCKTQRQKDEG